MITTIRRSLKSKKAKKVFLWVIIAALASGFIVFRRPFTRGGLDGTWIATIDGNEVSNIDFYMLMRENEFRLKSLRDRLGESVLQSFAWFMDPKMLALETLINNELLNKQAEKLSISLDPEYVGQKLANIEFVQRELSPYITPYIFDYHEGTLNKDALRKHLQNWRLSLDDFDVRVEEAVKRQLVLKLLSGSLYIPSFEIKQKYIQDHLARKFSVLVFDFGSVLKEVKQTPIEKEELQKFFNAQNDLKKIYWIPEKRTGSSYMFDVSNYDIQVDSDEINSYYENNKIKEYVKSPARVQVRRILFKIDSTNDESKIREKAQKVLEELKLDSTKFEQKAKDLSDDKETASQGGLMPFFAKGEKDKEFDMAAFLLNEDGAITNNLIRTSEGYELIQRVSKKMTEFTPLSKVRSEIKDVVANQKFKKKFVDDLDKAIRKNGLEEEALQNILAKAKKIENLELQEKTDQKTSKALFSASKDRPSYYMDNNKGFVVKVATVHKHHLPTLDTIEEIVKNDLYKKKAAFKLQGILEQAKEKVGSNNFEKLNELYKDFIVKNKKTYWVKSSDSDKIESMETKGLPVKQMLLLEKVGSIGYWKGSAPEDLSDGYFYMINEIEPFDETGFADKKDALKGDILVSFGRLVGEDFIAFLRKKSKIEINAAALGSLS